MPQPSHLDPACRMAPATQRNRLAIREVLAGHLPTSGLVVEVASGTGEHSCFFAAHFKTLLWQPSDRDEASLASIDAWRRTLQIPNLLPAIRLDVTMPDWPLVKADALLCINMLHIAPYTACEGLMKGAAQILPPGALLYIYGPFKLAGCHIGQGNEDFDAMLRGENPAWGVRDCEEVSQTAANFGMGLVARISMPANNQSLIFRRQ